MCFHLLHSLYLESVSVVNWENDGQLLQNTWHPDENRILATNFNLDYIFNPNVNWGAVTASEFSARVSEGGALFDAGGSACFPSIEHLNYVLGFLNSSVTSVLLKALNPTLNFQAGNIANLPLLIKNQHNIDQIVSCLVDLSRRDWDSFETSWDFQTFPLLRSDLKAATVEQSFLNWQHACQANIQRMQELETENNRLFIDAYGLQDELSPDVPEAQITLARADRSEDTKRLLSYALYGWAATVSTIRGWCMRTTAIRTLRKSIGGLRRQRFQRGSRRFGLDVSLIGCSESAFRNPPFPLTPTASSQSPKSNGSRTTQPIGSWNLSGRRSEYRLQAALYRTETSRLQAVL